LYRLVEQIVIVTSLCWLQGYFLTGFVVCLGKCGSEKGSHFLFEKFKPGTLQIFQVIPRLGNC